MDKDTSKWPSIKDHKVPKKTNVVYDKHMKKHVPTMKEQVNFDEAFGKLVDESMSAFDMVKKGLKDKGALIDTSKVKSKGMFDRSPAEQARRSKNWHDNQKGKDPYKPRAGESD